MFQNGLTASNLKTRIAGGCANSTAFSDHKLPCFFFKIDEFFARCVIKGYDENHEVRKI